MNERGRSTTTLNIHALASFLPRVMELALGAIRLNNRKTLDQATESSLIERCRNQDCDAFGKLVDAYQNRIFGFVRRMLPSVEDAHDVTQEVFIRAFQNFHRFDGRAGVRTWLFRIAYNLCVDRARKSDRSLTEVAIVDPFENEEIDIADSRWEPEKLALDEEFRSVVEQAILGMSEKLRSVLLLHDREDMQYEEIATMLGIPIGTVKSRLFLARAHLQKMLKPYLDETMGQT